MILQDGNEWVIIPVELFTSSRYRELIREKDGAEIFLIYLALDAYKEAQGINAVKASAIYFLPFPKEYTKEVIDHALRTLIEYGFLELENGEYVL